MGTVGFDRSVAGSIEVFVEGSSKIGSMFNFSVVVSAEVALGVVLVVDVVCCVEAGVVGVVVGV